MEYCTKEIQCEERQTVLSESSSETKATIMNRSIEFELRSLDVKTECEGPRLVDTEITTEAENEMMEMTTDVEIILVERSSEYSVESTCVDVAHEKTRNTVDFSGSTVIKTIEIGIETFGERSKDLLDCSTTNETESEIEETNYEFSSDVIDMEVYSETQFVEIQYCQEAKKLSDFGTDMKSTTIGSSIEYVVKLIESGMEVYKNTCEVETETVEKEILDEFSSYESEFVSVDCERSEIVEEIVAETEEQEKSEILRTKDASIFITISMNDISTVVECKIADASEEMKETYVDEISEWVNEVKAENEYVEAERIRVINVEISSETEYFTKQIECNGRQIVLNESCFETKAMMMSRLNEFELNTFDLKTECEGPTFVDSEIATEDERKMMGMFTDIKAISVNRNSEYFVESAIVDLSFQKEKDMVDFYASAEIKTIEIGFDTFGERSNDLFDCLTTNEKEREMKDTNFDIFSNVVDREIHSESEFVDEQYCQEDKSTCDFGMKMKTTMIEISNEYWDKLVECGKDVYRNTCEIETETVMKEIVDEFSVYDLKFLNADCERKELEEDNVAESEEEERTEILGMKDESVYFTILMNDISTVMECKVENVSEEIKEIYVDHVSEWIKEYKQENQYDEPEISRVINVEISSEKEYFTKEIECNGRQIVLNESSFETKAMMMSSLIEFELNTLDIITECEGPTLVDSEITTEDENKTMEMCTNVEIILVERSSEYSVESTSVDVAHEKIRNTVDFSGSTVSKTIEMGIETFGERSKYLLDCLTTNEETNEKEEIVFKSIEIGLNMYKNTFEVESETVVKSFIDVSSSFEYECMSINCETSVNEQDIIHDQGLEKIIDVHSIYKPELFNMICSHSVNFEDTFSSNEITYCVTSLSFNIDASVVGIQVNILRDSFDFSSNYNYQVDVAYESDFNLDFDDDLSRQSFPTSDGFEWAEVGLDLDSLSTEIGTQTLEMSVNNALISSESINYITFCSSYFETRFTSISTDCIFNENEYIMQYIRTNINSEMIRTIKEIISNNVLKSDAFSQTVNDEHLMDWVVETFGLDKLKRSYQQNKYVEESQNTDSIFSRSVFTQCELTDFNDILTNFMAPIMIMSSNAEEFEELHTRLDIIEEIEENIVIENEEIEMRQNNECQTQTNIFVTRTAGIQTIFHTNEYASISLNVDYSDDYFMNFTEYDDILDEVNFGNETTFRRTATGTIKSDNETQTILENRSCAIQTRFNNIEMYTITTIVDFKEDGSNEFPYIQLNNISNYIARSAQRETRSSYIETDDINLAELYWKRIVEEFLETIIYPLKQNITFNNSNSQTEEQYFEKYIPKLDIQEYFSIPEEISDTKLLIPTMKSHTTNLSENFEQIIEEREIPMILIGELRYSAVTESSQTDPLLIKDDFESVFEDDICGNTRYTMKTQTIENCLLEVIDTLISLPIDIKSVCHPSNNTKYPFNIALNRGWIDMRYGIYCNPSTLETMPLERAIQLKRIELMSERKCPNIRKFGLFKEKILTKIEKLRIKDILNTETGDLYDEKMAKEIGILSENGEFYDKEAKLKLSFEEAVLENYIEVFSDTEIVDSTIDLERNYKIIKIQDTETGKFYNFSKAYEKGLVDLLDATFKDTERNRYLKYDEAVRRGMIQSEIINNQDHLYIENEAKEHIIRQQMSLSSESYASRTQSFRSNEFTSLQ